MPTRHNSKHLRLLVFEENIFCRSWDQNQVLAFQIKILVAVQLREHAFIHIHIKQFDTEYLIFMGGQTE